MNELKRPLCAAPFTQLTLQPTGKVSPCCYLYHWSVGDGRLEDLDSLWNSPRMQRLRNEHISGTSKICRSRARYLKCHEQFERLRPFVSPSAVQKSPPVRLDIRLNGQCNLKCVMCEVWQEPNGTWDNSGFWREGPRRLFPNLKELDVLGGEPFIQKDTFRLIDEVSAVNPDCRWGFVTNGHYNFTPRLKAALDKIVLRYIQISIDSLDADTYSSIRRGGDLKTVLRTVEAWLQYRAARGFKIIFSMCVLKENWREVPDFLSFCKSHDAEPDLQFAFYDPSQQSSLALLNLEEKAAVIESWLQKVPADAQKYLNPVMAPLDDAVNAGRPRGEHLAL